MPTFIEAEKVGERYWFLTIKAYGWTYKVRYASDDPLLVLEMH